MSKKAQGTMLYFINPAEPAEVLRVGCVTSISGLGAPREQIDVTCLESNARLFEAGLPNPGTMSFGINFDPDDDSHLSVHALYRAGTKVDWAIGWSDGEDAPTLDTDDTFVLPDARSWLAFNGFVSDVPFEFGLNAVVASTVALQLSDFPEIYPKTAT